MTHSGKTVRLLLPILLLTCLSACTSHQVEIKPIHITIDINVKVDRALDDFFGDLDKAQAK